MSYDLMVFAPGAAPRELGAFRTWYRAQTTWSEGHGYDDPSVTTPELAAWFHDMRSHFPAMNGPHAANIDDPAVEEDLIADYTIGREVVCAGFGWDAAETAHERALALARKHRVGFYDPSGDDGSPDAELVFPE